MKLNKENHGAVATLIKHQGVLYGYLYSLLGNSDAAQAVLQKTNGKIWENIERLKSLDHFLSWAKRLAKFQVERYFTETGREQCQTVFDRKTADQTAENLGEEPPPTRHEQDEADLLESIFSNDLSSLSRVNTLLQRDPAFRRSWIGQSHIHAALLFNREKLGTNGSMESWDR